jgi:hypothetical protein
MAGKSLLPVGYAALLASVKERARTAQVKAALSANRELVLLYWDIGRAIVKAQKDKGYGKQVVEMLSTDLRQEFPDMDGFTARNLWFMRAFFLAYAGEKPILKQAVSESLRQQERSGSSSKLKQPVSEIVGQPARELSPLILSQTATQSSGETVPQPVGQIAQQPPTFARSGRNSIPVHLNLQRHLVRAIMDRADGAPTTSPRFYSTRATGERNHPEHARDPKSFPIRESDFSHAVHYRARAQGFPEPASTQSARFDYARAKSPHHRRADLRSNPSGHVRVDGRDD